MRSSALIDTGVLYAMADSDDAWHVRVRAHFESSKEDIIVPVTVLPEASCLLSAHLGQDAEQHLVQALLAGEMKIEGLAMTDLRRAAALLEEYADANIGFVDATVVAIAERLKIRRLLTTDRRHFSIIKPRHCKAFDLLP